MNEFDPANLAPDYIRAIEPYQPGKPIEELKRELGLTDVVKLASNENPRGPSAKVIAAISAAAAEITRYPDGNGFALKAALCTRFGVDAERIVLGNGSNDILELAAQTFLAPGLSSVYSEYCFAVYALATQSHGGTGCMVPARDYGHDLPAMRRAIGPGTRIVYIANPNNPTGTFVSGKSLEEFVASVPAQVIVVLDEAYNDYVPAPQQYDSVAWLGRYPNLIVCRTLSKAYGLAALRIGFGLMHPRVADLMNRVRQPFNVNSLAQAAAIAALQDGDYVAQSAELNYAGMHQIEKGLDRLGLSYVPSVGNFLLFHVGDASTVYSALLRQGVIVRPVGSYGLTQHLRVTIGLPDENQRFLDTLASVLGRTRSA